jgi:hypothetical protein
MTRKVRHALLMTPDRLDGPANLEFAPSVYRRTSTSLSIKSVMIRRQRQNCWFDSTLVFFDMEVTYIRKDDVDLCSDTT